MAIKANLVIDQGTDFSAIIDLQGSDDLPYNLTGHVVASQMRKNYTASSAAATFVCSHNGELGQINLSLPKSETVDIEPGRYMYDVEITSAGDVTTRVVEGIVTVSPGITRV